MSRLERIVAVCGGELLDGGRRALIPGPNHSPRDRSVSLAEADDGRLLIFCFSPRDDWREVRAALAAKGLLDGVGDDAGRQDRAWARRGAGLAQPAQEERTTRARRLWHESRPLAGSSAETYLERRAIPRRSWNDAALRFHPAMTSLEDRQRRPALMAALHDGHGQIQGVQATLLTPHGADKARLDTPRRVIGKLVGGAVRLMAVEEEMIAAEGVETSLSAADALGLPAWALLSAHNLSLFDPPSSVRRLVVALDNDDAGQAAFAQLNARHRRRIAVVAAPAPRQAGDWNAWAAQVRAHRY